MSELNQIPRLIKSSALLAVTAAIQPAFKPAPLAYNPPAAYARAFIFVTANNSRLNAAQTLEQKFKSLAIRWKREIWRESSLSKITSNPNYLRIIGLGQQVVPFIFKDLQESPAPWFVALRALNDGTDQVGIEHMGNTTKMADSWIAWGKSNGKI